MGTGVLLSELSELSDYCRTTVGPAHIAPRLCFRVFRVFVFWPPPDGLCFVFWPQGEGRVRVFVFWPHTGGAGPCFRVFVFWPQGEPCVFVFWCVGDPLKTQHGVLRMTVTTRMVYTDGA